MKELFPAVFTDGKDLYTINAVPGKVVYGEKLVKVGNVEYRRWDPYRSKLAAAIKKGLKELPIKPGCKVLYLGASTGTTVSHVSDIVGEDGIIFAVEISPTMFRELEELAESRENIIPILADARLPEEYEEIGQVDVVYQDIAQPDQDRILKLNARFLPSGGNALLCVKSQSIDVSKMPGRVFEEVKHSLADVFLLRQELLLEPYDKHHAFFHLVKK